jgi:hypothetical protein
VGGGRGAAAGCAGGAPPLLGVLLEGLLVAAEKAHHISAVRQLLQVGVLLPGGWVRSGVGDASIGWSCCCLTGVGWGGVGWGGVRCGAVRCGAVRCSGVIYR